jgi:hypothetical protein
MKNIFLLILTCALSSFLFGQGNLQFNQVLTYMQTFTGTYAGVNAYSYNSSNYTVPAGKTWKVEKFSLIGGPNGGWLTINNIHSLNQDVINSGPIWLKAGDVVKAGSNCSSCGGLSGSWFVSIIEFNIIP